MSVQTTLVGLLDESKKFQLLIDDITEFFAPVIWPNYLQDKFTLDLTWQSVLGVMQNSPAASVIDFSSGKPLRTRPTIAELNGELMTLGNKYQMSKREVRELINLQNNIGTKGIDASTIIDFLFPDLERAAVGPHKTIDRLFLEAISTGAMTLTASNNPDGTIWTSLDWGIDSNFVSTVWGTSGSATPLKDIKTRVDAALAKGVKYNLIKMSRTTFNQMTATTEFRASYSMDFSVGAKTVKGVQNRFLGLADVNVFLDSVDLPSIEIMEQPILIEAKDGSTSVVKPFADGRVSFSVDNNYGEMFRTFANEEEYPVSGKTYAIANNVLISKYRDNDGNDFTEAEFNAFPVINKVKQIEILVTDATS